MKEQKILATAKRYFHQRKGLAAVREHDRWWILRETPEYTETWAVHPADGIGTLNGLAFELIDWQYLPCPRSVAP